MKSSLNFSNPAVNPTKSVRIWDILSITPSPHRLGLSCSFVVSLSNACSARDASPFLRLVDASLLLLFSTLPGFVTVASFPSILIFSYFICSLFVAPILPPANPVNGLN